VPPEAGPGSSEPGEKQSDATPERKPDPSGGNPDYSAPKEGPGYRKPGSDQGGTKPDEQPGGTKSDQGGTKPDEQPGGTKSDGDRKPDLRQSFADTWRPYFSDQVSEGAGQATVNPNPTIGPRLTISADDTWTYPTSSGTWSLADVAPGDLQRWRFDSPQYLDEKGKLGILGAKRKIVLSNWGGGSADGPIIESEAGVGSFWVIYQAELSYPEKPGEKRRVTARIQFGR